MRPTNPPRPRRLARLYHPTFGLGRSRRRVFAALILFAPSPFERVFSRGPWSAPKSPRSTRETEPTKATLRIPSFPCFFLRSAISFAPKVITAGLLTWRRPRAQSPLECAPKAPRSSAPRSRAEPSGVARYFHHVLFCGFSSSACECPFGHSGECPFGHWKPSM